MVSAIFGLARDLGISLKEAHRYIAEYNAQYPGVRAYLDQVIAKAYELGYVETLFGPPPLSARVEVSQPESAPVR